VTICVDSLGDDFPTFPEFQIMLRTYEREQRDRARLVAVQEGIRAAVTHYDTETFTAFDRDPLRDATLWAHLSRRFGGYGNALNRMAAAQRAGRLRDWFTENAPRG
jgi:hypothetical protein